MKLESGGFGFYSTKYPIPGNLPAPLPSPQIQVYTLPIKWYSTVHAQVAV